MAARGDNPPDGPVPPDADAALEPTEPTEPASAAELHEAAISSSQVAARRTGRRIVAKTEQLADAAIDLLKREAHLPNIQEEASRVAAFYTSIHSRVLGMALGLYIITALTGVAVAVTEGVHDWFMHLAMYVVIFSFLVIYVKQHLLDRRLPRAFYALTTTALMAFFAWVLLDLVPARQVASGGQAVSRPEIPLLKAPAFLLLASAGTLLLHWLVLARFRRAA